MLKFDQNLLQKCLKSREPILYLSKDLVFEMAPSGRHRWQETVGNHSDSNFRDLESKRAPYSTVYPSENTVPRLEFSGL